MLAAELFRRYRVMWRTQRMDLSSDLSRDELWSGIRMALENNGRNSQLLSTHGFSTFMTYFVLQRLGVVNLPPLFDHTATMGIWSLCLTLSHQDIIDTPEETRNALCSVLRFSPVKDFHHPGALGNRLDIDMARHPPASVGFSNMDDAHEALLEKATPIIILIFALNEVVPITVPSHVPETRAVAIASRRSGPTAEDIRAISNSRTPLFTETRLPAHSTLTNPAAIMSNPVHLALYKSHLTSFIYSTYMASKCEHGYIYAPGILSGIWEGSFMCAISEYICFTPHIPISFNHSLDLLEPAVKSRCFGYEKYSADDGACARRNPNDALDVIFLGEV
ncbi:hypothetical protein C0991_008287 [Blastosporella zonata]|nr:hypothetical protein C0991_008287 [Blastosporella zonata]